jgi:hypothetical protein
MDSYKVLTAFAHESAESYRVTSRFLEMVIETWDLKKAKVRFYEVGMIKDAGIVGPELAGVLEYQDSDFLREGKKFHERVGMMDQEEISPLRHIQILHNEGFPLLDILCVRMEYQIENNPPHAY